MVEKIKEKWIEYQDIAQSMMISGTNIIQTIEGLKELKPLMEQDTFEENFEEWRREALQLREKHKDVINNFHKSYKELIDLTPLSWHEEINRDAHLSMAIFKWYLMPSEASVEEWVKQLEETRKLITIRLIKLKETSENKINLEVRHG